MAALNKLKATPSPFSGTKKGAAAGIPMAKFSTVGSTN